jgi:hypothetical protein
MISSAKIDSRCVVCRRFIRKGDQQEWFGASGDLPAIAMHPGCVAEYEARLTREGTRNAPQADTVGVIVETVCERCGADYAGRAGAATGTCACGGELVPIRSERPPSPIVCERCGLNGTMKQRERAQQGLPPGTCTKLGYMIKPSARRPGMAPASTCGGRLVPAGEARTGTSPETAAGSLPAADSPGTEGTGEPARSPFGDPLRKLDPQLGLGGVSPEPAGEIDERGGARADRTAPSGEEADR